MKEDSDQKERCNKKAEGKFGFFEDCQSDTTSKKAKKRSLYKQNIFCSSKLFQVLSQSQKNEKYVTMKPWQY